MTLEEYNKMIDAIIFQYEGEFVEKDQETLSNGIVLAGKDIDLLKEFLDQFEKKYGIEFDPQALNRIAIGHVHHSSRMAAGFCFESKTIKISPHAPYVANEYNIEEIILHEYTHAIDLQYGMYKHLIDDYRDALNLCELGCHHSEEHTWKLGADIDMHDFMKKAPHYNHILLEAGYPSVLGIINIREFVAMAVMDLKSNKINFNPQFKEKIEDLIDKYFKFKVSDEK